MLGEIEIREFGQKLSGLMEGSIIAVNVEIASDYEF